MYNPSVKSLRKHVHLCHSFVNGKIIFLTQKGFSVIVQLSPHSALKYSVQVLKWCYLTIPASTQIWSTHRVLKTSSSHYAVQCIYQMAIKDIITCTARLVSRIHSSGLCMPPECWTGQGDMHLCRRTPISR